jgi:hypothetical protein
MTNLPDRANLAYLKKQAKDLIRLYRDGNPESITRFRDALPAAAGRSDEEIAALGLRLHDAQSCVARSYGFASWADLRSYLEVRSASADDHATRLRNWLRLVYSGDVDGRGIDRANPRVAARVLVESPDIVAGNSYLACAVGDEGAVREATKADPDWVNRPGGPLRLPPLVAVTHSSLCQVPEFRERLYQCAIFLLSAGADPNQRIGLRWPPASVRAPDDDHPLSALYGAAGKNHDIELTKILLEAGANPNDGESLYHSLETRWVRLRLRAALWRQWKTPRCRRAALLASGVSEHAASKTAGSGRGPWRLGRSRALSMGLSNAYFRSLGLPSLFGTC